MKKWIFYSYNEGENYAHYYYSNIVKDFFYYLSFIEIGTEITNIFHKNSIRKSYGGKRMVVAGTCIML